MAKDATAVRFAAVCVSLFCCATARADVGNCMILRNASPQLEGKDFAELSTALYNAYSGSYNGDQDFVFILELHQHPAPEGDYTITPIELAMNSTWKVGGYRLEAADLARLRRGVAELKSAFRTNDGIHHVKPGTRKGHTDESPQQP